jgi:hypothetical protein
LTLSHPQPPKPVRRFVSRQGPRELSMQGTRDFIAKLAAEPAARW